MFFGFRVYNLPSEMPMTIKILNAELYYTQSHHCIQEYLGLLTVTNWKMPCSNVMCNEYVCLLKLTVWRKWLDEFLFTNLAFGWVMVELERGRRLPTLRTGVILMKYIIRD